MPEFIMENLNECERTESEFVAGFIECMFFTSTDSGHDSEEWFKPEVQELVTEGRTDGSIPGDVGYSDLSPGALQTIREFCEGKRAAMADLLALAYARDYDERQAGRDLAFTYNGHGVGYWDRKELEPDNLGNRLAKTCGRGELYLYYTESGAVEIEGY